MSTEAPLLVVGLGNPGASYRDTRHNVGFLVVEELARRLGWTFRQGAGPWREAAAPDGDGPFVLLEPLTYMNLSGQAVVAWARARGWPVTPAPAADTMTMQKVAPEAKKDFKSIPGDFTIQVASWATLEEAEKLAEFYNGKGYEARVENADVEGGRWYRVRIGHYKNSGDAHEVATQIAEKYKSDIWLVRL